MARSHMTPNLLQSSCDRQPLSSLTETSAAVPQQALGFWELLHHSLTAVSPDHYLVAAYFSTRVNVLPAIRGGAARECCFLSQSISSTATRSPTVYLWSAFLPISCQLLLVVQSHCTRTQAVRPWTAPFIHWNIVYARHFLPPRSPARMASVPPSFCLNNTKGKGVYYFYLIALKINKLTVKFRALVAPHL